MLDRFKFRVWDKFCETWLTDFAINQDGEINKFFNSEEALKRRFVVMQCTGLKDKNSKLIYEGDIVTDEIENYIVNFDIGNLQFLLKAVDHNCYYTFESLIQIEVIGNIYENPELLEW